jgi:hypothetical protein
VGVNSNFYDRDLSLPRVDRLGLFCEETFPCDTSRSTPCREKIDNSPSQNTESVIHPKGELVWGLQNSLWGTTDAGQPMDLSALHLLTFGAWLKFNESIFPHLHACSYVCIHCTSESLFVSCSYDTLFMKRALCFVFV